jgi:peptidoglycan/xylan/chitin deacetylase (PgdA/CDA1 family)
VQRPRASLPAFLALAALCVGTGLVSTRPMRSAAAVPAQPAGGWRSLRIAADTDRSFPRGTLLRLPAHLPTRSVHLAILMYHRIDQITPDLPSITRALTVSPVDFARQMGWIESHGYDTITQLQLWDALMHGRALPAHPVLVTFDDAYRDVVTYAAPVLARDHERATAYVITDRLSHGRRSPWMLWTQLRLLERDGFEIGSHTVSHADLVAVGPAEARLQLRASRFALQHFLGHPVQWLAYPYGRVDAAVERLARAAGYVLAVTTQGGLVQHADEPLLLHRYEITDMTGVQGLASLLVND